MRIKISNFQSIENLDIEVDKFTIIRGKNFIGKSALYRAIKAAFRNKSGDEFIRRGKPAARVTLDWLSFKNTTEQVVWSKARKTSSDYIWNGKPYLKEDRKVPDFMADLGMDEIKVGKDKLDPHFSSQHELPFLMSSSGGLITKFFSEVLHLGSISKSLVECSKDLKEINLNIKVVSKEIDRVLEDIDKFTDLPKLEEDYKQLELESSGLDKLSLELDSLKKYLADADTISNISALNLPEESEALLASYKDLKKDLLAYAKIKRFLELDSVKYRPLDLEKDFTYLSYLFTLSNAVKLPKVSLDKLSTSVKEDFKRLSTLKRYLKAEQSIPDIGSSLLTDKDYKLLAYLFKHNSIGLIHERLDLVIKSIKDVEVELDSYKLCPTCGQKID